jgi:hypothetical protein
MSKFERLMVRIRPMVEEIGRRVPDGLVLRRTYAGRVQRAQGAFSWWAETEDGREAIGSCDSITALLKAPRISVSEPDHWMPGPLELHAEGISI